MQVEGTGVDARGLDAELAPVPPAWQRDMANVVLEVEVLVLDPVGVVEFERDAQQLAAEDRRAVQRPLDVREDGLEAQRSARRRGLVVIWTKVTLALAWIVSAYRKLASCHAQLAHGWVPQWGIGI